MICAIYLKLNERIRIGLARTIAYTHKSLTIGSKYVRTRLILQSINMTFKYWICAG